MQFQHWLASNLRIGSFKTLFFKDYKKSHLQSFLNSIKFAEQVQHELNQNKKLFSETQTLLNEIESQFVPETFTAFSHQGLVTKLANIQCEHDDLIALVQEKLADFRSLYDLGLKYTQAKGNIDQWIQSMEAKIHSFEPIAIDVEIVEAQYEELQTALNEYELKTPDLSELNECANLYASKVSLATSKNIQPQPTVKLNIVSKLKRRNSSNTRINSGSSENLAKMSESRQGYFK